MAGKSLITFSRFFFDTFIFNPTLPSDIIALFSRRIISSIFAFFTLSLNDFLFTINCVVERHTVSTMRRLLALRLDPVSVSSTMASTSPAATLTSVAPQLNSTSAFTLFFLRYFFVTLTTSVATRLPSKSLTVFIFDPSGTASTQRTGTIFFLAYTSSAARTTSDEFSSTQSLPVMPQSSAPSAT